MTMGEGNPPVVVIAEAGVNHNGSIDRALELVDAAAASGADIVKFQSFRAGSVATRSAPKADYQKRTTEGAESQHDMLRRLELDEAAHRRLIAACGARGIEFLSTPADVDSLDLLTNRLSLPRLKLGSGEVTNAPLLFAAARTGCSLILSTGMATLAEVKVALGVLAYGFLGGDAPGSRAFAEALERPDGRATLAAKVTLLHCTTEYPAPDAEVNLRAMDTLRDAFSLPVGFSDHSRGTAIAIAAVGRGAVAVEKHFTLDRTLPGPDHKASLEPDELSEMVNAIRRVEAALGDGVKAPTLAERRNMAVARRSLVAAQPIKNGEIFTTDNLTVKRPGVGVSPMLYWDSLGQPATQDYHEDDLIE